MIPVADPPIDSTAITRALLNILEDAAQERTQLRETQVAIMNILDDFESEKDNVATMNRAVINILDDFHEERFRFHDAQKASLNILEDFAEEGERLALAQKAVLNILEDFDDERKKAVFYNDRLLVEVNERKTTQNALTRSNAELEQFAYIASHDLQAPLRTVVSYVEILSHTLVLVDPTNKKYFDYITEGVSRMQALIRALLDYSRVGRELRPFRLLPVLAICREVLRDLQSQIDESQAQIEFHNLPSVMGDYILLRQLFQNLISNSIKFRGKAPPHIEVSCKELTNAWEFRVQDNGIGIQQEFASRLFVIFQRLHERNKYPGTGIGLAICKKIVEAHQGRIWIEYPQNRPGITFAFTLAKDSGAQSV